MKTTGSGKLKSISEHLSDMEKSKQAGLSVQRGHSIYKEKSGIYQEDQLKNLIANDIEQLMQYDSKKAISLSDFPVVRERTIVYLKCCQETGTFPSNQGLARMLGYNDKTLRTWRQKNGNTETGQWLEMFADMCAETLHQSALKNNANTIMAIFLSKANYDMKEENRLVISQDVPLTSASNFNEDQIRERLGLIQAEGHISESETEEEK